jgi:hypothetical protein
MRRSLARAAAIRHMRITVVTSTIVRFPPRRLVVWIMRDGGAWLVLAGVHGWVFGNLVDARREAKWLARNHALPVREVLR